MYRILRRYLVGDLVKYVSFPLNTKYVERINNPVVRNVVKNSNKLENNLVRAKNKIKDYVLCNDFKYFVTITCNNEYINRNDLDNLRRVITNKIRYFRKKYNVTANYILIPEKHKKGGYHLHGVLDESFSQSIYINRNGYDSLHIFDNIGFSSIESIKSVSKVSSYITKYVSKDFAFRGLGEHLYYCSRGLKKPLFLEDIVYNNEIFNDRFFDIRNDFCFLKYYDKNINWKSFLNVTER